jgi:hypothetical protein
MASSNGLTCIPQIVDKTHGYDYSDDTKDAADQRIGVGVFCISVLLVKFDLVG